MDTEDTDYDQAEIVDMYSQYVSAPKAEFFKRYNLDVIQGKGDGLFIEITTSEGETKRLLNCRTSGGVFNLGHQNPEIKESIQSGIEEGLEIGDHHLISKQRALLAKKLADLLPGEISKTQYCAVGGEAIDLALKLARGYTKRTKVVSATTAYHGVTGLSLAAGDDKFSRQFQWSPEGFIKVPFGDISAMEEVLDETVSAVILETIPATGGILISPPNYFSRIRELCDTYGIIMISDEVQTGLGRTGELWGISGGLYPDEKVVPDIMVLAKGMSAGYYPLSTCSYKPFLEEVFMEDPFVHISTTGGSELGCRVTSTMLDIISDPEFLENVQNSGKVFEEGLTELKSQYPFLVDIRGRGLMWGMEFADEKLGPLFTVKMIENGIFADYCGNQQQTVKLMPPLVVTPDQVRSIIARLSQALQDLAKELS